MTTRNLPALSSICTSCAKPVGFLLSLSLSFIVYLCHFSGTEITSDAQCEKCKRATSPFIGECRKLEGHFQGGCRACVRDGHATTCEVRDAPSLPLKQVEIVEKTSCGGRQTKAPAKYTAQIVVIFNAMTLKLQNSNRVIITKYKHNYSSTSTSTSSTLESNNELQYAVFKAQVRCASVGLCCTIS